MIILSLFILFGCASGEGEILTFGLTGATLVGEPVIDSANRTVTATVEIVNLSTVTPVITLSEGASCTAPALTDSTAATCTVTAENGSEIDWTITVTVNPGIFFTYGDTKVALTKGFIDSTDPDTSAEYGNDVPFGTYLEYDSATEYAALANTNDLSVRDDFTTTAFCLFLISGKTTGSGTSGIIGFLYDTGSSSSPEIYIRHVKGNTNAYSITEYGSSVGDYIKGTFSLQDAAYKKDSVAGDDVDIENGFFKVKRIADDHGID